MLHKPVNLNESFKTYLLNSDGIREAILEHPDYPICFTDNLEGENEIVKTATDYEVEVSDILFLHDDEMDEDFFVQDELELLMAVCFNETDSERKRKVLDYYKPYWRKCILVDIV